MMGDTHDQEQVGAMVEAHGRALLLAIPDLVFNLGRDGTYLDVFSAPDEDLFMPREDLLGQTVLEILPPPVGAACMAAIGRLSGSREVTTFDYSLPIGDHTRWFEGRVALAGPDSVICVVRDFTDQRQAEDALQEANATLQKRTDQLERLGRELTLVEQHERRRLAGILHDQLQQLLVAAKYNVAIVEGRLQDETLREVTARIKRVLDDAITQSQSLTLALCPPVLREGDLPQALEWIARRMQSDHGLEVTVRRGDGDCSAAAEDLRIVMFNAVRELLLNVVKHAGVSKADIDIQCSDGAEVVVTVSDAGHGFDPQEIAADDREHGGFGLFAIRERFEPMGGRVDLCSTPGKGTAITLRAPIESAVALPESSVPLYSSTPADPGTQAPPGAVAEQGWRYGRSTTRVLLVDDHAIVRQGMAQLLSQETNMVVVGEAADGEEAVELARELEPDVVLMDVNMPVRNGVDATRAIHAAHPQMKVIGLSMYEEQHRIDEMLNAGAVAYLSKGEAADRVVATIHEYCPRPPVP
jgi:signal transduction histidine kinase